MKRESALAGMRVLVVEDDMIVALDIKRALTDAACTVVGPVAFLEEAVRLAREEPLDAAVVDINLNGDPAYPVTEALAERGVPFVFITGYGDRDVAEGYRARPRLRKPFSPDELRQVLARCLAEAPKGAGRGGPQS